MKWQTRLLADRHVIGILLEFLKSIQVENREAEVEKEERWEQRRDWHGENQLD